MVSTSCNRFMALPEMIPALRPLNGSHLWNFISCSLKHSTPRASIILVSNTFITSIRQEKPFFCFAVLRVIPINTHQYVVLKPELSTTSFRGGSLRDYLLHNHEKNLKSSPKQPSQSLRHQIQFTTLHAFYTRKASMHEYLI